MEWMASAGTKSVTRVAPNSSSNKEPTSPTITTAGWVPLPQMGKVISLSGTVYPAAQCTPPYATLEGWLVKHPTCSPRMKLSFSRVRAHRRAQTAGVITPMLTIDPIDDCTFWYTQEYATSGSNWRTRIGSFKFPSCRQPKGGIEGYVYNSVTNLPVPGVPLVSVGESYNFTTLTDASGHYFMT